MPAAHYSWPAARGSGALWPRLPPLLGSAHDSSPAASNEARPAGPHDPRERRQHAAPPPAHNLHGLGTTG
eukprot:11108741-Prorocentrum_lima.AAC.1